MTESALASMPRVGIDETVAFWREGYPYVSTRCDALGTDAFRTRLLMRPVVCARGSRAAQTFYDGELFTRTGAMPRSAQHLLQDVGSVQDLDGERHARRKELFLGLLAPTSVDSFIATLSSVWETRTQSWRAGETIELYSALNSVLTEAAMRWVGLPTGPASVRRRCSELSAMVDYAGAFGPTNWWARLLRRRSERWAMSSIDGIRSGHLETEADTLVQAIATHREDDEPLDARTAAVELLNVLRPVVAISRFAVFAAVAMWSYPQWRERVRQGNPATVHAFVQEVRRYYPFFPVIGGEALRDLDLAGHRLAAGTWVILDLYGTNHDPRVWADPQAFAPERFDDVAAEPNTLVPQGGGEYASGHRCPGEAITVGAVGRIAQWLAADRYILPAQDLTIDLSRMPALPRSGMRLTKR